MQGHPEVLIVGAGPAGIAAALKLARAGVRVLVLEGAEYAGAENWSGCVYHADALLRDDVLGRAPWDEAPKERRIVARALFLHDGLHAAGFEARANAGNDYGEAWTVLRPKLDRWLAARAIDAGATVLTATTVTGLRTAGGRVVGVNTDRGPVDADVVFIAEGDASQLLAREGLERVGDQIPAKMKTSFGIEYILKGVPAGEPVKITLRYLHPMISNPETGKKYTSQEVSIAALVGKKVHEGYTFDHEWELVTGAWVIQVFYDGRKLAEQYFTVYKP